MLAQLATSLQVGGRGKKHLNGQFLASVVADRLYGRPPADRLGARLASCVSAIQEQNPAITYSSPGAMPKSNTRLPLNSSSPSRSREPVDVKSSGP